MINPNATTVQGTCRRCGNHIEAMYVFPLCDPCVSLFLKAVDECPDKDENGQVGWGFLTRFYAGEV
jgi:hypothetical protein